MQAFSANTSKPGDSIVVVLGTGGTIAGTAASAQDVLGYTAAQLGVEALVGRVAGINLLACRVESEQVAQVDSKDMDVAIWQSLVQRISCHLLRPEVVGIAVTHGTDTVEETAFFLQCVLPTSLLAHKLVVVTCAMRPATALDADGPQNLLYALRLASAEATRSSGLSGVVMVCAGVVHSPRDVQKVHPTRLDPFNSGDAPTLGSISPDGVFLATSRATSSSRQTPSQNSDQGCAPGPVNLPKSGPWPRVEIVVNHAGASGAMVDALLAHNAASADPVRGLVVAGTGNGSIHDALLAALLRAQAQGIKVVRCSRCAFGSVQAVAGHPLPGISTLSPVKARIQLMLDLMQMPDHPTSRHPNSVVGNAKLL